MRMILAVGVLVAAVQSAPLRDSTVEGTVTRSGTTVPIAGVQVMIAETNLKTESDGGGRFFLSGVRPGRVTVRASLQGYLGRLGTEIPSVEAIASVTVSPGQTVRIPPLALTPAASIHGKIVDASGHASVGASVECLQLTRDEMGRKTWRRRSLPATSDAEGNYACDNLVAGDYYIRAVRNTPREVRTAFYYPGTWAFDRAVPVVTREGEHMVADLSVPPEVGPTFRVVGRVTYPINVPAVTEVTLVQRVPGNPIDDSYRALSAATLVEARDGHFEFPVVRPGTYDVFLHSTTEKMDYVAKESVEVRDNDVEDLVVPLLPGLNVTGHLVVSGNPTRYRIINPSSTGPGGHPPNVRVVLNRNDGFRYKQDFQVDPTGTWFTFPNVPTGDYQLSAKISSPGVQGLSDEFIEDIRVGGRSIHDKTITVGRDHTEGIEVFIGTKGGFIEGRIPNSRNLPIHLVLVPDNAGTNGSAAYRHQLVQTSGNSVAFQWRGIPPGRYIILAVSALAPILPYRSLEFQEEYRSLATKLTVSNGARIQLELPVITLKN